MRRFQKKPEVTFAFIPGVGRVGPGQVLEGDRFAVYVPSLLVELPAAPAVAPPAPPAPKASAPRSVIELPADPPPAPTAPGPAPSAPRAAPKTMAEAGFVAPEELVAAVDAENKQTEAQIEQAVARLDPVAETPKEAPKPKPGAKRRR